MNATTEFDDIFEQFVSIPGDSERVFVHEYFDYVLVRTKDATLAQSSVNKEQPIRLSSVTNQQDDLDQIRRVVQEYDMLGDTHTAIVDLNGESFCLYVRLYRQGQVSFRQRELGQKLLSTISEAGKYCTTCHFLQSSGMQDEFASRLIIETLSKMKNMLNTLLDPVLVAPQATEDYLLYIGMIDQLVKMQRRL